MMEANKIKEQKDEMEAVLRGEIPNKSESMADDKPEPAIANQSGKPDRNMKVCEVCGAL